MDRFKFDYTVIGAGVLGLAVARRLTQKGAQVLLLEAEKKVGQHNSSRNSEVIHAGLYYPSNSKKAEHCINGRQMLYDFLSKKDIEYKKVGKIVFATNNFTDEKLAKLYENALLNEVTFEPISNKKLQGIEFLKHATSACFSPETGIFDTHSYLNALQDDFETWGGTLGLDARVARIYDKAGKIEINVNSNKQQFAIETKHCILCCGNQTLNILKSTIPGRYAKYSNYYNKGHYFSYNKKLDINHLLYPVPEADGLGVHLTVDLAGSLRFGPDVNPVEKSNNYQLDISHEAFVSKIQKNFPYVGAKDVNFTYSGIRPNIKKNNKKILDFKISTDLDGKLISVLNFESPGLTASLSMADASLGV